MWSFRDRCAVQVLVLWGIPQKYVWMQRLIQGGAASVRPQVPILSFWHTNLFIIIIFKFFWTKVHFVGSLITDYYCGLHVTLPIIGVYTV